jgi:hypothetical protein
LPVVIKKEVEIISKDDSDEDGDFMRDSYDEIFKRQKTE